MALKTNSKVLCHQMLETLINISATMKYIVHFVRGFYYIDVELKPCQSWASAAMFFDGGLRMRARPPHMKSLSIFSI